MAEQQEDKSQKTEEPTSKKLQDARDKGQVPNSREVNNWFMILAATIMTMFFIPPLAETLGLTMQAFLERPHAIPVGHSEFQHFMTATIKESVFATLPIFILLMFAALASGLVQNGVIFSAEQMKPKLEKLSIQKGLKRLFSAKSVMEFVKGIAKLTIVTAVGIAVIMPFSTGFDLLPSMPFEESMGVMNDLTIRLLIGVLAIVSLIAGADFLFQRAQHTKEMRMSRQDIKDELKQSEGDPLIRARLRQIRRERAQSRMMQAVPEASVVITNPTHYAVALKYELDGMSAPVVVAKGIDHVAAKIREIAADNDVPIMPNPPLARALHAGVEVGDEIPADHYKAVAEIIGYVLRLRGKLPGKNAAG